MLSIVGCVHADGEDVDGGADVVADDDDAVVIDGVVDAAALVDVLCLDVSSTKI
jgi:hypothetical protein